METEKTSEISLTQQLLYALRYYLGNRKVLIGLAVVALLGGVILNWNWLVAAGLAPIILALAPCAAMCALGLCMNKLGGKSCSTSQSGAKDAVTPETDPSPTLSSSNANVAQKEFSENDPKDPP